MNFGRIKSKCMQPFRSYTFLLCFRMTFPMCFWRIETPDRLLTVDEKDSIFEKVLLKVWFNVKF